MIAWPQEEFPRVETQAYYYICSCVTYARKGIWDLLWCVSPRITMPFDARRESDSLHIPATEIRGAQLSNAWLGIGNHCPCTKKLATLFDGGKVQHLYEPQKSKVYMWSKGIELKTEALDETYPRLWLQCRISPWKTNVVANTLSRKNPSLKSRGRIALLKELGRGVKVILNAGISENLIARFQVKPTLEEEIMRLQTEGPKLRRLVEVVRCERRSDYAFKKDGALLKNKRLCAT